ncbi:MAG TPA: glutathione S-transferase family protein [Caulobacteraceae bacterium]|nr:glutathione S-transferase family protein [Caulobacteraceae bacterium]
MADWVVYGAAGSGSVPVEAAMTLIGLDYEVVEGATWTHDPEILARVETVNPLKQIPAVVTPDRRTMTESAAILTWLADSHPAAGLAPALDDPMRGQFLRWMVFVPASIYALYWIRDEPTRLVPADLAAQVKARTAERIAECWGMMESQLTPGRYLLGEEMTVLDLYVAVVSRWGPRRRRFYEVAPRMSEVIRRVDADPRLDRFWAERFPFEAGWEG